MKLSELERGQKAIIKEINLPEELRKRFQSLGLVKNEFIHICRVGFLKGSFYVKFANDSCIIISKNEADHIEVELFKKGHQHRWGQKRFVDNCMSCCGESES